MFSIFKNRVNPKEIAFAIITQYPAWYRGKIRSISHTDKIRGDLALEFIKKSTYLGYQLVVVDGKSSKSFRKDLSKLPNITIIKRKGKKRSPAKRQAFLMASKLTGVKVIIATEPEKVSLVDNVAKLANPILRGEADIVVPKREANLFKETYPYYLYESEIEGNRLFNEQLKLYKLLPEKEDPDLYFGPRVFRNKPAILSVFNKKFFFQIDSEIFPKEYFDSEEYANTQFFPIVLALKKGFKIQNIEIPFSYPKLQKENESIGARELFEEKRKSQSLGILLLLMHLLNYLKH